MQYFGISEGLIKKTQEELKMRIKEGKGNEVKQGMMVEFEKSMLALSKVFGKDSRVFPKEDVA